MFQIKTGRVPVFFVKAILPMRGRDEAHEVHTASSVAERGINHPQMNFYARLSVPYFLCASHLTNRVKNRQNRPGYVSTNTGLSRAWTSNTTTPDLVFVMARCVPATDKSST